MDSDTMTSRRKIFLGESPIGNQMSAFISWRRLDMSEDEKLYLVCDDSPGEPRTKEEIENDRRLDNDPVVQAKIQKDMEEAKRIFGLEFNNKNNNHQI